ncbi:aspartate--tRNA ligase [Microaerobacter geothermalis]|uniref:aspartate--tRNA ligase n=1 Tax=Microaerobacter geothermalis TaxID=674972 RepID=UPI001F2BB289|nr:aspartate--tRNA ligase [Microaerobacter geothermalis]MCF6092772.1 aspartate--tRNA ligase [Microaerobacter geothermalis]
METLFRTHHCGLLSKELVGQVVKLSGWVQKRRDLGGLIFVDVRDRSGLVQVVFGPEYSQEAWELADKVRSEFVITVEGKVVERSPDTINPNIKTGEIEVQAINLEIINPAKTPPFLIQDDVEVEESIRLKYRYLDLRRPVMQKTLKIRHQAAKIFRDFLDQHGFLEIETPMLTKSTPEGARDYLVPSRVHPGEFYALPQSPQLFKQLLMVAGYEKYFQIVRCFRDEDLRADRQPEFTQVDIETSFMKMEELHELMEELMAKLMKEIVGITIERPFLKLSYQEAIERYGSDKPDLRFGLELVDVSDLVENCNFKVFRQAVENGGQVKAINAKGCGDYSRKEIDLLGEFVARYGAKGLAWLAYKEDGLKGPIAKFFSEEELQSFTERLQGEEGDLFLFVADNPKVVADALGNLRLKLGRDLNLIDDNTFKFLWVIDFPLLSYDEEEERFVAEHHPFTMPREEDIPFFDTDPGKIRAQAYDMVLNGYEIGGGSMRIFKREIQEKMFQALGFSQEEAKEKFGFLLEAFEYGTPPHGGIAFGFDRIVMILAGRNNLRECIAFPKTASATDLMTHAPDKVDDKQLKEIHISITNE